MSLKSGIVAEERRIERVRTTAREIMNATITLKGDAGHGGGKKLGCVLGRLNLLPHAVATAIALYSLCTRLLHCISSIISSLCFHHALTHSPEDGYRRYRATAPIAIDRLAAR